MQHVLNFPIKIAVSSCLMGEAVRYDGSDKKNLLVTKQLASYFSLQPICPEVSIGLGIPRAPIMITQNTYRQNTNWLLVETNNVDIDYTEPMLSFAKQSIDEFTDYCGYIVKERSPSCGYLEAPRFSADGNVLTRGAGLFTEQIINSKTWLPIISEQGLEDSKQLDNFLERVFVVQLWLRLTLTGNSTEIFYNMLQEQLRLRAEDELLMDKINLDITNVMAILKTLVTKDMQLQFLHTKARQYKLESRKMSRLLQQYQDKQRSLLSVIRFFQNAFEENKLIVNSNYFYPDKREILSRGNYFGI